MKRLLMLTFLFLNIFSVIDLKGAAPADEPPPKRLKTEDYATIDDFNALFGDENVFCQICGGIGDACTCSADATPVVQSRPGPIRRSSKSGKGGDKKDRTKGLPRAIVDVDDEDFELAGGIVERTFGTTECPICFESFSDECQQVTLPIGVDNSCGHSLCWSCLQREFTSPKPKCSLCRVRIPDDFRPDIPRNIPLDWDNVLNNGILRLDFKLCNLSSLFNCPEALRPNITTISLLNNDIRDLDVAQFSIFPNLKKIIIINSKNLNLKGQFSEMPNLKNIQIDRCFESKIENPRIFDNLKNLKYLFLSPKEDLNINFAALTNLRLLKLINSESALSKKKQNEIRTAVMSATQNQCKIYFTTKDMIPIGIVNKYGSEEKWYNDWDDLDIDHVEIKSLDGLNNFEKASEVISLNLSFNLIVQIQNDKEKRLPFHSYENLKVLNLSNNRIETINKNSFDNLRLLEVLNLSGNLYTDLPVGLFKNLSKLRILTLSNSIQDGAVKNRIEQEVRAIAPAAQIEYVGPDAMDIDDDDDGE